MKLRREQLLLNRLSSAYGIAASYRDVFGRSRRAPNELLKALLAKRGVSIMGKDGLQKAWDHYRSEEARAVLDPVSVAWEGRCNFMIRTARRFRDRKAEFELESETGRIRRWSGSLGRGKVRPPFDIPLGYYTLRLKVSGRRYESFVISAPLKAWSGRRQEQKSWGVFVPLYALRSGRNWGSGDFTDLARLKRWAGALGAREISTLPLFSSFLAKPFDPSPYRPVSRLFWNEFYLDVTKNPEWKSSASAQRLVKNRGFQERLAELRRADFVNYRTGMAAKREVLEALSRSLGRSRGSNRHRAFDRFRAENPGACEYARFRAVCEKRHSAWKKWPARQRGGFLREGDYPEHVFQYHLYVQWLLKGAMKRLSDKDRRGVGLALDFPLGVHPDGFDAWRHSDVFSGSVRVGAPPDAVFTSGQDWGFAPPDPDVQRRTHYRYFRDCIATIFEHASWVRMDHCMAFHRLYWIPDGFSKKEGAYVHYPAEEFYAIMALESHKKRCRLVGENLGTVPPRVNVSLDRHGVSKMYVVQYERPAGNINRMPAVGKNTVASINTHDMFPFAAYWRTSSKKTGRFIRTELERLLRFLARSRAALVIVNLEDLWLETAPQNIPGTGPRLPNWKRKARMHFEEFSQNPFVLGVLGMLHKTRKAK